MPIAAENRGRYPRDWATISARIRRRAGGRCECKGECGIEKPWHAVGIAKLGRCPKVHGRLLREYEETKSAWRVILTVAHRNHAPEDCRDENLAAFCQACHLAYDAQHHRSSRRERQHRAQLPLSLFGREEP